MQKLILSLIPVSVLFAAGNAVDRYSTNDLSAIEAKLSATHPTFKSEQLKQYKGHYTMLAHREATGSSEVHEHEADVFVITDGQGTLVTGGKLVNSHVEKPGELRGTSIAGGERILFAPGDIIHITAGVPHQMLIEKGNSVSYFVVKVTGQ
jgi:mannose-6-phosphate isomerase-like protein (cupin superfamily)